MATDLYYHPENYGLKVIGAIEWTDEPYEFDLTIVWRRESDGAFLWGDDSGCSCPGIFENKTLADLKEGTYMDAVKHIDARGRNVPADRERDMAIAALIERIMQARS